MQCLTPIFLRDRQIYVPCGKCNICKLNYIKRWSARLCQESEFSDLVLFVTLTISDDNYKVEDESNLDIQKITLKNFFKRLRYYSNKLYTFRYFAVSELGSKTGRLHYHTLIFFKSSLDISNLILKIEDDINKSWTLGFHSSIKSNTKVISYLLKYEIKDIGKKHSVRLISKGLSSEFADKLSKQDLLYFDKYSTNNKSYNVNRYIIDRIFPHSRYKLDNGKITIKDINDFEEYKDIKHVSTLQPENVYKDLCKKFLPNLDYNAFIQEFFVKNFDNTDYFCRQSYFEDLYNLYIVPFHIVVNYFNNHICLTKKSKL